MFYFMLDIKVIPNSRKARVSIEKGLVKVHVNAPAVNGKANEVLIDILSEFLKVKKNRLKIVKGEQSRLKQIKII